jgi:Flp pilus assembly protein TadG
VDSSHGADDRGSVAAEFAVAVPAVLLVLALGVAALGACSRQVRLQDAAADAARLIARGDSLERAQSTVAAAAPGARLAVSQPGDLVCADARAPSGIPLAALEVTARACALGTETG